MKKLRKNKIPNIRCRKKNSQLAMMSDINEESNPQQSPFDETDIKIIKGVASKATALTNIASKDEAMSSIADKEPDMTNIANNAQFITENAGKKAAVLASIASNATALKNIADLQDDLENIVHLQEKMRDFLSRATNLAAKLLSEPDLPPGGSAIDDTQRLMKGNKEEDDDDSIKFGTNALTGGSVRGAEQDALVHDEENQPNHTCILPMISDIPRRVSPSSRGIVQETRIVEPKRGADHQMREQSAAPLNQAMDQAACQRRTAKQTQAFIMIVSSILLICSAIYRRHGIAKSSDDSFQTSRSPGPATFLFLGMFFFFSSDIVYFIEMLDNPPKLYSIKLWSFCFSMVGCCLFLIGAFGTFLFIEEKEDIGRWTWRREVWITGSAVLIISNFFQCIVERNINAGIMTFVSLGFGQLHNIIFLFSAVLAFDKDKQHEAANSFIAGAVLFFLQAICFNRSIDFDNVLPFSSFFRRLFLCNDDPEEFMKDPTNPDDILEYNRRCRDIIKEENNLVNHRMSWFLQFQGFLFLSASGFVTRKSDPISRIILAFPGICSGYSIKAAITAAEAAMNDMNRKIQKLSKDHDVITYPIWGLPISKRKWRFGNSPKSSLVGLIQFSWIVIAAYSAVIIYLELEENPKEWRKLFIEPNEPVIVEFKWLKRTTWTKHTT
ncbi:hypothetical protein CTEN210_12837 [Chaetoceros tenuissimus]|uniref:Uncharacterized protein n=1 Tax=Chaetoceros tenuissimus TaxID=426638 RepID=A0AAD3D427_9STRA|nr:hypothetical protein CTEN210_12837 [Chaetoceros tenuissimus]